MGQVAHNLPPPTYPLPAVAHTDQTLADFVHVSPMIDCHDGRVSAPGLLVYNST